MIRIIARVSIYEAFAVANRCTGTGFAIPIDAVTTRAIQIPCAGRTDGARWTCPTAAVDIGFGTIPDAVRAGRRGACVVDTDPRAATTAVAAARTGFPARWRGETDFRLRLGYPNRRNRRSDPLKDASPAQAGGHHTRQTIELIAVHS